jgi:hypothetical protein
MDGHQLADRVVAGAMVVAPVLLLTSTLVAVAGGDYNESTPQGVIEMFSLGAFFLAVMGATRLLADALPRLSTLLLVTGTLGCQAGVAFGVVAIARSKGLDMPEGTLALAFNSPALLFPLTWLVAGVSMVRTKVAPVWVGVILALAGLAFPPARAGGIVEIAVVDDLLFLVGLIGLAAVVGKTQGRRLTAAA